MGLYLLGSTPAANSDMLLAVLGAAFFVGLFLAVNLVRNDKVEIATKRLAMCSVAAVLLLLGLGLFVGGLVWLNNPQAQRASTPANIGGMNQIELSTMSEKPLAPEFAITESVRLGHYGLGMLTGCGPGLMILAIILLATGFNWDFKT